MSQWYPSQDPYRPPESNPPQPPPQGQMVRVSLPKITPYVVYFLLGFTVLIFLLQNLSQALLGDDYLFYFGAKINPLILQGELWRLITPIFLHANILHIGFNMYALYIFGPGLERSYGHWRFAALYFLGGFAGNVLSFLLTSAASLGSSTAIFGLVVAEAAFVYQNRRFFGNRTRGVLLNILLVVVINLGIGATPGSGIDNWGHVGGLLGGLIFSWFGGPIWDMEGISPNVKLVDTREPAQTLLAGFVDLAVFGGLTIARFFMK